MPGLSFAGANHPNKHMSKIRKDKILSEKKLHELDALVDEATSDMDRHPERYVPDPDKFWREMFDWSDERGEFYMDGSDLLACGDPPIPSPDDDLDDGWTSYNYTHDMYRVIPASVVKRRTAELGKGPRGVEVISFSSGDMDGNWDTEAQFVRHQKGVKITEEDRQRLVATGEALEAARTVYNAASREDSVYGDLYRAWCAAADAHNLAKTLRYEDIEEECWDPEEFRYYAVQLNCYWTLLHYKRYEIWCALHGEDPLGNVRCESEEVAGTFDVTSTTKGGETLVTTKFVRGDRFLEDEAVKFVTGYSVSEIKRIIRKNPRGIKEKKERRAFMTTHWWKPRGASRGSVTLRISIAGRREIPLTPERIREVSCRGLEKEVKDLLKGIEKHYPRPNG